MMMMMITGAYYWSSACYWFFLLIFMMPSASTKVAAANNNAGVGVTARLNVTLAAVTKSSSPDEVAFDASHRRHPAVVHPGDIMFGGLFPVHEKGEGKACGAINAETGFQRLQAMIYAVDKLNEDDTVLPGIKIGIHAHDTCQHDIYAMDRVLEFIAMRSRALRGALDEDPLAMMTEAGNLNTFMPLPTVAKPSPMLRKPVIAVIGPSLSSITTAVASVLRLFQIPQISYAATSTELSDRARFDYFFRVVPPDNLQAEVMASIVHSLKWRYVWAVGDEGPYGYKGIKSFAEAIDYHVCIGQEFFIPRNAKDKFFDDLVDKMAANERARGVILFCNEGNIRRLLQATVRRGRTNQFYWLASDSWGAKQRLVQGLEDAADGAITILPQKEVIPDFDVHMRTLSFRCNNTKLINKNPWVQEYWEQINNCSCQQRPTNGRKRCPDSTNTLSKQFRQEGLIQFVIDSVYALAHALRNVQKIYCGEVSIGLCSSMKRVIYNGTLIRDFIQNVSFYGISKTHIQFNAEGGVEGKYEVYQFRLRKNGTYEYVKTGWWNSKDGLALHQPHVRGSIQTFCARGSYDEPMPVSYCSEHCPNDQGYQYTTDNHCCWHCERCHKNQFLNMSSHQCDECPHNELQSANRVDQCEEIRFVHIDWATIWPCIPLGLACAGLAFNGVISFTFIRYNQTPIIKASGRESSVILLTGLACTFITILLQLLWPSFVSCTIMRLGMPVSLTMCYASIFTKTHRIYRIFMPSLNNLIHRPPFISPKSQIIMSLLCTGVSFLLSMVCLTLEPPEVEYFSNNLPETIVRCRIKNTTFFLTFIYDILVIVATTSLAWQVRNIPENFNEAKYIAFLMYSSCVVWVGLMPIYFLVTSNYTVQMTSFLLCITLSAVDIQLCMFGPKLYVVYTGNNDLLQRGKGKFTYATARQQAQRKQRDVRARNPAELAMVILKSAHDENVAHHITHDGTQLLVVPMSSGGDTPATAFVYKSPTLSSTNNVALATSQTATTLNSQKNETSSSEETSNNKNNNNTNANNVVTKETVTISEESTTVVVEHQTSTSTTNNNNTHSLCNGNGELPPCSNKMPPKKPKVVIEHAQNSADDVARLLLKEEFSIDVERTSSKPPKSAPSSLSSTSSNCTVKLSQSAHMNASYLKQMDGRKKSMSGGAAKVRLPVEDAVVIGDNNETIHLMGRKARSQPLRPAGMVTMHSLDSSPSATSSTSTAVSTRSVNSNNYTARAAFRQPVSPLASNVDAVKTPTPHKPLYPRRSSQRTANNNSPTKNKKTRSMFMSVGDGDKLNNEDVMEKPTSAQTAAYLLKQNNKRYLNKNSSLDGDDVATFST